MKRALLILVIVTASACNAPGISVVDSGNQEITVTKIATIEGCNVYRFMDGGTYRYTTICPSGRTTTQYKVQQGKVHRPEMVEAVPR